MASSLSRNDSSSEEEGENEITPTEASFDGCEASGNETNDEGCSNSLNDGRQQNVFVGQFNEILERMDVLETQQRKYEAITQVSVGKVLGLQMEQQNQMTLIDQLSNAPQQFASNANSESAVIGDLQTKFTTFEEQQKKILDKISTLENFNGILKDKFRNELLKAVQPELRPMIAEKFSNPLQNCWDSNGRHSNLEIFGNDCLIVQYLGKGYGSSSVFAKYAIPSNEFGIFFYEMKVENVKNSVSIGLGVKGMPLYESVGQYLDSYAYESNGTVWVNGTPKKGKEQYTNGDVVGFGVNLITRRIITTKNGLHLDTAHLFLSSSSSSSSSSTTSSTTSSDLLLFPCVTLSDCGDKIEANFGSNFQFDPANAKLALADQLGSILDRMEEKQQQKYEESEKSFNDKFSQLHNEQKTLLGKISDLEKQQQMLEKQMKTYSEVKSNCWDANTCHGDLAISGLNRTMVHRKRKGNDTWCTVFAEHSIVDSVVDFSNIFYFELNVKNLEYYLSFGFAVKDQTQLNKDIIDRTGTYAYEWNGDIWINGNGRGGNETFGTGDTVGCGVNLANKQLFFTKNGHRIDAPNDFLICSSHFADSLFPFVSLFHSNAKIDANFGSKFMFEFPPLLAEEMLG